MATNIKKGLCAELSALVARFWWCNKENGKGIHWVNWQKMTKSKALGGFGFKDFEKFNTALLAKQFWRLSKDPDSLWAKFLKSIYFPNNDVWEAPVPEHALGVGGVFSMVESF